MEQVEKDCRKGKVEVGPAKREGVNGGGSPAAAQLAVRAGSSRSRKPLRIGPSVGSGRDRRDSRRKETPWEKGRGRGGEGDGRRRKAGRRRRGEGGEQTRKGGRAGGIHGPRRVDRHKGVLESGRHALGNAPPCAVRGVREKRARRGTGKDEEEEGVVRAQAGAHGPPTCRYTACGSTARGSECGHVRVCEQTATRKKSDAWKRRKRVAGTSGRRGVEGEARVAGPVAGWLRIAGLHKERARRSGD